MRLLMRCLAFRMASSLLRTQSLSSRPFNPLQGSYAGGSWIMSLLPSSRARQPPRAWSMERLLVERSITLCCALDRSTQSMYSSALNSYLTFCQLPHLDPDPTVSTLSLYITFMLSHIEHRSVPSYLAGIVCELKPSYRSVYQNQYSPLLVCTLKGSMRHFSNPVQQKSPLSRDDLKHVYNHLPRPLTDLITTFCSSPCSLCASLACYT